MTGMELALVSTIGASPIMAIKSLDIPCGSGSVSGILMTLFSSLTLAGGGVGVEGVTLPISKSGSSLISSLTSSTTSMGSMLGTGVAATSAWIGATEGVAEEDEDEEDEGGARGSGLVLSENISSLSKSTEHALVLYLDF